MKVTIHVEELRRSESQNTSTSAAQMLTILMLWLLTTLQLYGSGILNLEYTTPKYINTSGTYLAAPSYFED